MAKLYGESNPRYKTGLSGKTAIYSIWQNMKGRCLRPSHPKYPRYGGRGIRVCDEWIDIGGFLKWASESGYQPGMSIDPIDNDGDYVPDNCRWVSKSENSRRKSTTKITFDQAQIIRERLEAGEDETALAEEYGVVHGTIWFIKKRITHVPDGECIRAIKRRTESST